MEIIWTVDGDRTSWAEWASRMALSPSSNLANLLTSDFHSTAHSWALDLGCGTGRTFLPLHRNGFRIIGIDPIFTATKASLERARSENLTAIPILATASRLPIQSNVVKLIFALGILFHLSPTELDDALQEIHRILDKDGKAVLHFLDIDDWRRNLANSVKTENIPIPSYHAVVTCFCSQDAIQEKITSSGLKIEKRELKTARDEQGERREWIFYCSQ
jgi:ubiquinone/menaquinone biosynthesis C-methylase UbiE